MVDRNAHSVRWSRPAVRDLEEILDYIALENPGNVGRILARIKKKTAALVKFPDRGRHVPEFKPLGIRTYRELVLDPWRIIYRVASGDVYVLGVINARRNVEDILLQRLTRER